MKADIHPQYFVDARVMCSCGNTWTTGSTREEIRTDLCHQCHPFFTGEQRIVDTEGQVERFRRKLDAHVQYIDKQSEQEAALISPELPLVEFALGARSLSELDTAGITIVEHVLERLTAGGDRALLKVDGFGRKSLIDLKKALRTRGFELPDEEVSATVV